jgi:hypothetical protein
MPRSVPFLEFEAMSPGHDRLQAELPKLLLAEHAGKEPALVRAPFKLDDERAFELRLGEDHVWAPDGMAMLKRQRR